METLYFASTRSGYMIALVTYSLFQHALADVDLTRFVSHRESRIKTRFTYLKTEARTLMGCAARCLNEGKCKMASYIGNTRACNLSEYSVNSSSIQEWTEPDLASQVLYRKGCSDGWVQLGDLCYKFLVMDRTYWNAKKYCEELGGKLIEPRTSAMNQLIINYLNQTFGSISFPTTWLGMAAVEDGESLNSSNRVWSSDGSPVTFNDWAEEYVDDGFHHDCAMINGYEGHKWSLISCDNVVGTACEI